MATATVKSTYSLDLETIARLDTLARRWTVSKSEALRRAIRGAAGMADPRAADALEALDELQRSLRLTAAGARNWQRSVRVERRAAQRPATPVL